MTAETQHPITSFDRRSQAAAHRSSAPDLGGGFVQRVSEGAASLLQRFPGYKGYRSKEDRRDSDRNVRDHLVQEYGRQLQRVQRVATDLANAGRVMDVGAVDQLVSAIRRFSDRINTASYGYGGLFGDRDIDERALEQMQLFDEGLMAGVSQLDGPIGQLETAARSNGDLQGPAQAGRDIIQRLDSEFDMRSRVVDTAQPEPDQSVRAILALDSGSGTSPSPLYWLDAGDAISVMGQNGIVDSRLDFAGGSTSVRLFRFTPEPNDQWLLVPAQPGAQLALLSPEQGAAAIAPGASTVAVGKVTYNVTSSDKGQAELITPDAVSGYRPVTVSVLNTADGGATGIVFDWGNEQQAFTGVSLQPTDVENFGKPPEDSRQRS